MSSSDLPLSIRTLLISLQMTVYQTDGFCTEIACRTTHNFYPVKYQSRWILTVKPFPSNTVHFSQSKTLHMYYYMTIEIFPYLVRTALSSSILTTALVSLLSAPFCFEQILGSCSSTFSSKSKSIEIFTSNALLGSPSFAKLDTKLEYSLLKIVLLPDTLSSFSKLNISPHDGLQPIVSDNNDM